MLSGIGSNNAELHVHIVSGGVRVGTDLMRLGDERLGRDAASYGNLDVSNSVPGGFVPISQVEQLAVALLQI